MITKEFTPSWKTFLLIGLFGWAYLPTLGELFDKWMNDPQYSHGILVPLFSVYLLFRQSNKFPQNPTPWPVLGFTVLAIALLLRGLAALLIFLTLDILRWSWQALVFSLFMIPLPYQVERMMGAELQQIATLSSTFLLQSFGQPALSEGNLILIEDVRLGVVEACSGLRMLMTFLAFAFGAVMLMDRGWVVKVLVLASAIPIALLTNILRITATGLVHIWMQTDPNKDSVLGFIHDFNGWMMMPVGLIFLMLELWLFKYLLIEPERVTYFR
jgi:exosortase